MDALPLLPADYAALVSRADLSGKLPPVLRAPRAGEEGQLRISVGQLELELEVLGFALSPGVWSERVLTERGDLLLVDGGLDKLSDVLQGAAGS